MREIKLTQGKIALVDDEDYEYLNQWNWQAAKNRQTWYAITTFIENKIPRSVRMHRLILNTPEELQVDHKDHNGLNNQKLNLRNCNNMQNRFNSMKRKETLSIYKGVTKRRKKPHNRWRYISRITINGELINLGVFDTEIEAAKRYDVAAKENFGEFAYLNFN